MQIASIEAWACEVPLAEPFPYGSSLISARKYTAIRVTTRSGIAGEGLTLSRGAPIDVVILEMLAPLLIGLDAFSVTARMDDLRNGTLAFDQEGVVTRGKSVVEFALLDIVAQACGVPLWRLMGGDYRRLPVLLVEGYSLDKESETDFVRRLCQRVDEGFSLLKLEGGDSRGFLRLEELRRRIPDEIGIVLDVGWSWHTLREARNNMERLGALHLSWVEDPLPKGRVRDLVELRQTSSVPIGAGDELSSIAATEQLISAHAVDVVRLDACAVGGVSEATSAVRLARREGLRYSFHGTGDINEQLAFGSPGGDHVEIFPKDRPFDRAHELMRSPTVDRIVDGSLTPPSEPGAGVRLDLDAVERYADRYGKVVAA
jgi:L-alanine-DL-glutamate epimerase-like enolase superfamily enzyme